MERITTLGRWLAFALAVLAALILAVWGWLAWRAGGAKPPNEGPVLVREGARLIVPENSPLRRTLAVEVAAEETVAVPFTLPAVVEANPARLVKVLTPLVGRIVCLNKVLGDDVRPGDVLFTVDSSDLAQARSDAAKAQAALTLARENLERQQALDRSHIAARHDLEQAQSDYEEAASEAARAQARLAQLGAHLVPGVIKGLLAVRAPIAGRVIDLAAAAGGYWNDASAPLMTVADLSRVFVTASVQEKDLPRVHAGQMASVRLDAYPDLLRASVDFVGSVLEPDTRTAKVRMVVENRDWRLKPGMFAEATLFAPPRRALMLPLTAVVLTGFSERAFVEVAPWQFEPRTLRLGAQLGERVEVLAGLRPGERVVVRDGVVLNG
ncbi:efflux RND transporter periplasmic adaptor subunit [Massilia horti]|uniref:Efflux RND transporter periplasmic adaptor subunit n=1 Tax=Massilia horti TaxID=2562153 RepID=A0A4Y9T5X8_9BURK|nr:efflux RND transporter periplasmic adaptor subunit [Massilia horti]TFW35769.1 efflux RND transporter periplasmic adaptor subunit [Massilia horti]